MVKFKVIQHREAVVRYEAEIDADSPQAALNTASTSDCDWVYCGTSQYDKADMEVHDLDGNELIPTREVWS